jgi:hypothetical protein
VQGMGVRVRRQVRWGCRVRVVHKVGWRGGRWGLWVCWRGQRGFCLFEECKESWNMFLMDYMGLHGIEHHNFSTHDFAIQEATRNGLKRKPYCWRVVLNMPLSGGLGQPWKVFRSRPYCSAAEQRWLQQRHSSATTPQANKHSLSFNTPTSRKARPRNANCSLLCK